MTTDRDILDLLPLDGESIGIREVAAALDTTVRRIHNQVERMARAGALVIDRPTGGYAAGQRRLRRDGVALVVALRIEIARLRDQLEQLLAASLAVLDDPSPSAIAALRFVVETLLSGGAS